MEESDAFKVAEDYLSGRNLEVFDCFDRSFDEAARLPDVFFDETSVRGLVVRNVWAFSFAMYPPPPVGTVRSGGSCIVYVDSDSGDCGFFSC